MNTILHNIQLSQLPLIHEDDVAFNQEMKSRSDDLETGKWKAILGMKLKQQLEKSSKLQLSNKIIFHPKSLEELLNRSTGVKNRSPAFVKILSLK